jgi:hypothetical protein
MMPTTTIETSCFNINEQFEDVYSIYDELSKETGFLEKYNYIDSSWFIHLNNNEQLLQILSVYNLSSPVMSLLLPIIFLILPFFILKFQGINLSMTTYFNVLKQVCSKHAIGHLFTNFKELPLEKQFYMLFSIFFYCFQIYQNGNACIKFYRNLSKMHTYLLSLRQYIDYTLDTFDHVKMLCTNLGSYSPFIQHMNEEREILYNLKCKLDNIKQWKLNIRNLMNIGFAMKCFYTIYSDDTIKHSLTYSFGFHGFINNIEQLKMKLDANFISSCKFSKKKTIFKDAYFPSLLQHQLIEPIKNSYNINKHILITGPNAAGKTTLLKTTLFNILFSQQTCHGFYSNAVIPIYSKIHCYLNIPDTSGRDSLFQAEARRCKNIIIDIENDKKGKHFCVFDELYSGTNPYEAISASIAFLKYLNKFKNTNYMLTTHFLDVCKSLDNDKRIINCHMNILNQSSDNSSCEFKYTYKLKQGISSIKGGVKVLVDLDYPAEIIKETKLLINKLDM